MSPPLKLNLGCGHKILAGYLNVDQFGSPDLKLDIEKLPWPWKDNSVEEIVLSHVLEHLGQQTQTYLGIIKELYRVCRDGAVIKIAVPNPRHDNYLGDPTHVRPITPQSLSIFSKKLNQQAMASGAATTTLAIYLDVDFEIREVRALLDPEVHRQLQTGKLTSQQVHEMARAQNNVIQDFEIDWIVRKS